MRRLLALLLPLLLLVTACSPGTSEPAASEASPSATVSIPPSNSEALASVKVEDQGKGKAPKVTFDKPLAIKAESMRVVTQGDGAQIKDGQIVSFQQVMFNATDAAVLGETFTKEQNNNVTLDANFKSQFPMVYTTFASAKVGSYIAYGLPGQAAVAGSTAAPTQAATPAQLSVFFVTAAKDAPPAAKVMSSDDVKALVKEGKLPVAKFDAKGIPSITIPKNDAPADLAVEVLTEGTGAVLTAADTISALYTGWTWNGKQFDSAYDRGTPSEFPLKGVIQGWTLGLAGQKVGSTVLLTIPSSLAYGPDAAAQGKPDGPLVFVVKIESKK
ncbi:FKBP-type peptidyl-prolyl cis-trans isomerase [Arthrobacter sp. LAPM80]|uniref:FKBP-type peptidyl-prolyl cis-trans isomerase n=1 Tax=Arthrobacter sp. LAPM80 TaxID=3141788 RepID=UPI00398B36EF